jgi:hypothetical protein
MARYSDIKRGAELNDQFVKYKDWLDDTAAAKKASYAAIRAKPVDVTWERENCFILPFSSASTTVYFEAKALTAAQTSATLSKDAATLALDLSNDYSFDTLASPAESVKIPGFRFARVIATERTGTNGEKISRISGKPYKQYQTVSASCPFGRTSSQLTLGTIRAVMLGKAAYKTFVAKPGNRVSIIPERG